MSFSALYLSSAIFAEIAQHENSLLYSLYISYFPISMLSGEQYKLS